MIKAGIMEAADVFVVNKTDLPGADRTLREVQAMLGLNGQVSWKPPVVAVIATQEKGIDELFVQINRQRRHLQETGEGERRALDRLAAEAADLAAEWARRQAQYTLEQDQELRERLRCDGTPYAIALELWRLLRTSSRR
jgi:LAO/AO transport system kinase